MIKPDTTVIRVGIAGLNIVESPAIIRTSGLGSCVGIVIYDLNKKIAGLAHVMLPDSTLGKKSDISLYKYADTAIDAMIHGLIIRGSDIMALNAKIAGGAEMFKFSSTSERMRIGPRNVEAVKRKLSDYKIDITSEDVGGSSGRTIEFNPSTGDLYIRTVNKGETII